jgi:hypothetical protein
MAASVRIESDAFEDLRYAVLARLCHLADADHAIGKMARLWRQCTAQQTYTLDPAIVASVLGENGPSALVSSGLGEPAGDEIRIKGTEGRIEWLGKLRKNARKGGRARGSQLANQRAAKRQPNGSHEAGDRLAPVTAKRQPNPSPPTPIPIPIPTPTEDLDLTPMGERESAPPAPKLKGHTCPSGWTPDQTDANREALAKAQQRGVDVPEELKAMRDWSLSSGAKGKKTDWNATWRNWLRKSRPSSIDRRERRWTIDDQMERARMLEEQERLGTAANDGGLLGDGDL